MATTGQEAVGSMGTDTPISALSDRPKLLYTYFKQNFAQVTNPPIDPIREELVMSLVSFIGPRPNLFDLEGAVDEQAPRSAPADPRPTRISKRSAPSATWPTTSSRPRPSTSPITPTRAPTAWRRRIERLCERAERAVHDGIQHHHPVRPAGRAEPRADSGAAGDGGRPSSPDPQGPAHLGRASSSRPAKRARCIISACSPATAPRRSTPISPSRRSPR